MNPYEYTVFHRYSPTESITRAILRSWLQPFFSQPPPPKHTEGMTPLSPPHEKIKNGTKSR